MHLTKCEVSLILVWSENCVLTSKSYREAVAGDNPLLWISAPISATFAITDTRFYIPVVTFQPRMIIGY